MDEAPSMDVAYVDVPHEPTLSHSTGPSTRVMLPLEANPRAGWLLGLLSAFVGSLGVLGLLMFGWLLVTVAMSATLSVNLVAVPVLLLLVGTFGCLTAVGLTGLSDSWRRRPVLTIGADGLRDTRVSPNLIPWSTIEHAEIDTQVAFTLTLLLRPGLQTRHWPFRFGVSPPWRLKANEAQISLAYLGPGVHTLSHVIRTVAQRNGVVIVPPRPRSDWYDTWGTLLEILLQIVVRR